MILPKRLKKGDTIGVVAPASPPDMKMLENGIEIIETMGFKVRRGKNLSKIHGYLAGSDQERVDDIHEMFLNPDIAGIICASGGYGSGRLADQLNYNLIAENPKVFWGYSDITYLHTAIRQETELVTFHGPMISSDAGRQDFHPISVRLFQQLAEPITLSYTEDDSPLTVLAEGEATGELVGGNLSLLVSTLGTPYEINTKDKLLLIEDVGEEPYRIDDMLNQLRLAGKLDEAAGIVVGSFTNVKPARKRKNTLYLEDVFEEYLTVLHKPVLSGFLIGHCSPNFSVPLGTHAKLSTEKKQLIIEPGVK